MNSIEVCLSPDLLSILDLRGKTAIVVDVLRATSCMVAGLSAGVDHIIPFDNVEECQKMKLKGYITAGERNGAKIDGMDIGNSPFDYLEAGKKGKMIAATTTNGTRSIHLSEGAKHIITGSFLNISAVEKYIRKKGNPVVIVCAGWKGKVNLEDSLMAGNLVDLLNDEFTGIDDSSLLVHSAYRKTREKDLFEVIRNSEHARRLAKYNIVKDIKYCSQKDLFDVVPELNGNKLIPAVF